jgi:hypothetical protein
MDLRGPDHGRANGGVARSGIPRLPPPAIPNGSSQPKPDTTPCVSFHQPCGRLSLVGGFIHTCSLHGGNTPPVTVEVTLQPATISPCHRLPPASCAQSARIGHALQAATASFTLPQPRSPDSQTARPRSRPETGSMLPGTQDPYCRTSRGSSSPSSAPRGLSASPSRPASTVASRITAGRARAGLRLSRRLQPIQQPLVRPVPADVPDPNREDRSELPGPPRAPGLRRQHDPWGPLRRTPGQPRRRRPCSAPRRCTPPR